MKPYTKSPSVWQVGPARPQLARKKRGPKARWEHWYGRKSQRSATRQQARREIRAEVSDLSP